MEKTMKHKETAVSAFGSFLFESMTSATTIMQKVVSHGGQIDKRMGGAPCFFLRRCELSGMQCGLEWGL